MNDVEKRINKMLKKSEVILNAGKQTHEEWFCQLSTEEKAKVFGHMLFEAWKDGLAEEMHDKEFYEDLVDFWLKQPHCEDKRE